MRNLTSKMICLLAPVLMGLAFFSPVCASAFDEAASGGSAAAVQACQGDSDCDGLSDEDEAVLGTDPKNPDTDGDGLLDGEEGDRDKDGKLGPNECDALKSDTDGDGVSDGVERRLGTKCNVCDTDEDGLSDGVELGYIQPEDVNGCHGLQPSGTNYKRPHEMDPLSPDSDGDGLSDGEEDKNGNGWVDPDESDPSLFDTDGDGLSDGVEALGDFDGDGYPDFDYRLIKAGQKCSPPESISDLDCDGIPNSRSLDSDGDGCPDAREGGWVDSNGNGVPDVYDNQAKTCPDINTSGSSGSGSSGSASGGGSNGDKGDGSASAATAWAGDPNDGGACAMLPASKGPALASFWLCAISIISLIGVRRIRPR